MMYSRCNLQLLALAPMLKGVRIVKHTLIALLACAILWIIAGIIWAVEYKSPQGASIATPPCILALIFTLAILRRSASITMAAAFISTSIIISGMLPILQNFHAKETPTAIAALLSYLAAVLCIIWTAVDFSQTNHNDRIGGKHGEGWRTLN
jgi:drug/metabolite transporter (DMT)-like permease